MNPWTHSARESPARPIIAGLVILTALCLAQAALAFDVTTATPYVTVGQPTTFTVKGRPPTGTPIVITGFSVSPPGGATVALTPPQSGSGSINVTVTPLVAGNVTITFFGTNKGSGVSGGASVFALSEVGTSEQDPNPVTAGDPVNTVTGEYYSQEAVDLSLGGPMPLVFARYSASRLKTDGLADALMGDNRMHNFASKMLSTSATLKQVILPSGRVVRFQKTGAKWVLMQPLDKVYALIESGTNFLLGHPDTKQIWTYNSTGQLIKIEDGKGNAHTLIYSSGKLTGISDGLGRNLTLAYTGSLLTSVSDQNSRVVTFSYTGSVLTAATDIGGHTTTYGNSSGLPTSMTRPMGNTLLSQVYTGQKVTSQTARGDASTLAYGAGTTTFTDPTGAVLTDNFNAGGQVASHVDQAGKAITMSYDSAGRRTSVTDRLGATTSIAYHALSGLPATVTNAEGKTTALTYKSRVLSGLTFYDLSKATYPDGSSRSLTYDAKGNVTQFTDEAGKVWKYTYNANGQILTVTNPLGGITTYTYNPAANRISSKDAETGQTDYMYDAFNRVTQITRPSGATIIMAYDIKDRITSFTDERGKVTTFAFDDNDRLLTTTDPDSQTTGYNYDVLDRPLQVTDRLGKTSTVTFNSRQLPDTVTDANGNSISIQYDTRQRPVSFTDAGGQVWPAGFDNEGLPTSSATPINPPATFKRNKMGQIIETADPLGNTRLWTRDSMQRIIAEYDPLGRQTTYTYDKRGLLINAATQGIGTAKYDRDGLGNITKITDPNGGVWTCTYSKAGRLLATVDPLNKKWSRTYDSRGRLSTTTYPDATTCTLVYDAASHVIGRNYNTGPSLAATFDNQGRLATVDGVDLTYDAEGRITNAEQNGLDFNAGYDDGGRLKTVSYTDGAIVVTYVYDSRGRVTKVSDNVSGASVDCTYDNAGRLTHMARSNGVDGIYDYDAAGRLTRIREGPRIDLKYTLNAANEIVEVDSTTPLTPAVTAATQTFAFGKASQITTAGYAYDARGRLTAAPGHAYGWDAAGRLTHIDSVTLEYNGMHDVVLRTEGANTTRYYHHYAIPSAPIVYEDTPSGSDRAYVWTPGGELLYSIDVGTTDATFYLFDAVGSTLALTNEAGADVDTYAYGPFGEPLGHGVGASTQPFTYIGAHGVRMEGALYQMRKRYYDPQTARFLSRDPLPPDLDEPQTLNPYQYAVNDPLTFIDPEGTKRKKKRGSSHSGPGGPHSRDSEGSPVTMGGLFLAGAAPKPAEFFGDCLGFGPPPFPVCPGAGFPCGAGPGDPPFPGGLNISHTGEPLLGVPLENVPFPPGGMQGPNGCDSFFVPDESAIPISNECTPEPPQPQPSTSVTPAQQVVAQHLITVYIHLQQCSMILTKDLSSADGGKALKAAKAIHNIDKAKAALGEVIKSMGGTPPPDPQ